MATTFWAWLVSALIIAGLATVVPRRLGAQSILRDARGRHGLSRMQMALWCVVLLVLAYVAQAVAALRAVGHPAGIGGLPAFSDTFLVLLGVSHAGYLLGKVPSPAGVPQGVTMRERLATASQPSADGVAAVMETPATPQNQVVAASPA